MNSKEWRESWNSLSDYQDLIADLEAAEGRETKMAEAATREQGCAERAEAERDAERKTSAALSDELTHLKESILAMGMPKETMLKSYEAWAVKAEAEFASLSLRLEQMRVAIEQFVKEYIVCPDDDGVVCPVLEGERIWTPCFPS